MTSNILKVPNTFVVGGSSSLHVEVPVSASKDYEGLQLYNVPGPSRGVLSGGPLVVASNQVTP